MYMTSTAYPVLRASLAPEYFELADEQLDSLVAEVYGPGVSADAVESFWNDVGRGFQHVGRSVGQFAQQAAPALGRALPDIAKGAASGAALGPWGALAGAVAGGAGSLLSQSKDPTLRGIGGAVGGVTQLAGGFTGGGALGNLAGIGLGALGGRGGGPPGSGAAGGIGGLAAALGPQIAGALGARGASANALLGLLSRPETLRALSSAGLGQFGRSQVMVGSQQVPVQSILNALGGLAGRAATEAESAQSLPAYYYGADGELALDPADSDQRLTTLLALYALTPRPQVIVNNPEPRDPEFDEFDEAAEPVYTEADARRDAWLLASEAEWYGQQEDFYA